MEKKFKHRLFNCYSESKYCIFFVQVFLNALSRTNPTKLNGLPITLERGHELYHKDIFTIGDRHFRWEYSPGKNFFFRLQ
jgi:hypothetical protein